jgi:hypothetical protein
VAFDVVVYHEPAARQFAADWPAFDFEDYLSATTPGFHLLLAALVKFVSGSFVLMQVAAAVMGGLLAGVVGWANGGRASPLWAVLLTLPVVLSAYVMHAGAWPLPDDLGWLGGGAGAGNGIEAPHDAGCDRLLWRGTGGAGACEAVARVGGGGDDRRHVDGGLAAGRGHPVAGLSLAAANAPDGARDGGVRARGAGAVVVLAAVGRSHTGTVCDAAPGAELGDACICAGEPGRRERVLRAAAGARGGGRVEARARVARARVAGGLGVPHHGHHRVQDGSYLAEFLIGKGYEVHGIIRRSSSFNTAASTTSISTRTSRAAS